MFLKSDQIEMPTNVNKPLISKLLLPQFQNKSWCKTSHINRSFSCVAKAMCNRTRFETEVKKQLINGLLYCVVPENICATSIGQFFLV